MKILILNASLKFSVCTGCMKCRSCGKCIFAGDDADVTGKKIVSADFLVVASPCWWGNMTGSLKSLFDRNVFRMMGESKHGIPLPLLKGKKAAIVTACTTPFPFNVICRQSSGVFNSIGEILKSAGIKITAKICAAGTKHSPGLTTTRKRKISNIVKALKAKMYFLIS
ncbi:flavodoxin family protein [uncultured Treponema sp.]|uniref:flavodoxin family protein n=1 Tax=uncultured Treponema sp. TaxID=162155 RepID=UPI0025F784B5|nr:flavodoxin family protein [uncultured Treponema sp.]